MDFFWWYVSQDKEKENISLGTFNFKLLNLLLFIYIEQETGCDELEWKQQKSATLDTNLIISVS